MAYVCKLAFCLSTHLQTSFECARRNGRLDTRLQVYFMHLLPHSFLKYVAKWILYSVFYLNFSEDHKTETRPYYHTVSPKPMNICVVFDNKRNDLKEVKSVSIKIAVYLNVVIIVDMLSVFTFTALAYYACFSQHLTCADRVYQYLYIYVKWEKT